MGTPSWSARIHCDWPRSAPVQETGSKYEVEVLGELGAGGVAAGLAGVDHAEVPGVSARSAAAAEDRLHDGQRQGVGRHPHRLVRHKRAGRRRGQEGGRRRRGRAARRAVRRLPLDQHLAEVVLHGHVAGLDRNLHDRGARGIDRQGAQDARRRAWRSDRRPGRPGCRRCRRRARIGWAGLPRSSTRPAGAP